ncbi:MAG: hypothetical protein LBN93_10035 [Candidatus Symbiothrix sp.]|jgi:hypothetical protein|nr:hypothetical protein [Candidatus Symbiothrix sp.]
MGTIEKINIIYSFMAVKGIGFVQTNKFLSAMSLFNNSNDIENTLSNFLTEQQKLGFIENKEKSEIKNIKSKYNIDFLTQEGVEGHEGPTPVQVKATPIAKAPVKNN